MEQTLEAGNEFLGYLDPGEKGTKAKGITRRLLATLKRRIANEEITPVFLLTVRLLQQHDLLPQYSSWPSVLFNYDRLLMQDIPEAYEAFQQLPGIPEPVQRLVR